MKEHANKKDFFYIVVLILTFITVIVGATFALYALIFKQEEGTSAVYTGTLSIEYLSGKIIDCHLLYPTEKPSVDTEDNVYKNNFRVTNTGSLDSVIDIQIEIDENEFSDKTLMFALYNENNEELSQGYVEGNRLVSLAQNIVLEHNTTAEFTVIIWIYESGELQNEEMKKSLTGLIRVDAIQKIE